TQAQEVQLGTGQEKDFERLPPAQNLHFELEKQTGMLNITSYPDGVEIWIGGTRFSTTPIEMNIPPGTYNLEARKEGYITRTQSFQVEAGKENSLRVTLEKEPPVTGTLRIKNPDGHSVYIDTVFAGWDKEYEKQVKPGSHTVDYKDSGKTVCKVEISVKSGQVVEVEPTPPPSPIPTPVPTGMVVVEGKDFWMGYLDSPTHVDLDYDFVISKTEVTFSQYDAHCNEVRKSKPDDEGWGRENRPVINVSWWDAIAYCNWLSEKEGFPKAYDDEGNLLNENGKEATDLSQVKGYRLPTQVEWEFAARGGLTGSNGYKYQYSGGTNLDDVGWYWGNAEGKTQPVGRKKANDLGLYDMSGNVWEWCNYSANRTVRTEVQSTEILYRGIRGGSWRYLAENCGVAVRYIANPSSKFSDVGFRAVRTY
ncbi:MAG TPA: SUMF1/EgtB/PvdO family nonheme iron enzyme, partial [Thermotogota bacterium]|nr:SUMF1/EgtB/PvdO family nonheme iron enzyme [Thermotogota bacterium]